MPIMRYRMPLRPMLRLADTVNRLQYGYTFGAMQPIDTVAAIAPRPTLSDPWRGG